MCRQPHAMWLAYRVRAPTKKRRRAHIDLSFIEKTAGCVLLAISTSLSAWSSSSTLTSPMSWTLHNCFQRNFRLCPKKKKPCALAASEGSWRRHGTTTSHCTESRHLSGRPVTTPLLTLTRTTHRTSIGHRIHTLHPTLSRLPHRTCGVGHRQLGSSKRHAGAAHTDADDPHINLVITLAKHWQA